jgi:signal transduction histidine kinase
MSPRDVERAFDPFYTTKEGGTGLGLAVVQRIMDGHGGGVKIQSEPGKGTTVTLELPA